MRYVSHLLFAYVHAFRQARVAIVVGEGSWECATLRDSVSSIDNGGQWRATSLNEVGAWLDQGRLASSGVVEDIGESRVLPPYHIAGAISEDSNESGVLTLHEIL